MNDKKTAEGKFILLPPAPDKCQECAVDHPPEYPHNKDSMYYQFYFYRKNGRWPNWEDAMAHCSDEMKEIWIKELKEKEVILNVRSK